MISLSANDVKSHPVKCLTGVRYSGIISTLIYIAILGKDIMKRRAFLTLSAGTMIKVCHKIYNQLPNSYFCDYCG
jgi:hypothetical protein